LREVDFLIVGAGIIGLSLAWNLKKIYNKKKILVIDKENNFGFHSSGRNSGVIHSGIYYKKGSLKSIFSKEGNLFFKQFCDKYKINVKSTGKLIVPTNEQELEQLFTLKNNADENQIEFFVVDDKEVLKIEENVKLYKQALYVPSAFVINPLEVMKVLYDQLKNNEVEFSFEDKLIEVIDINKVRTTKDIVKFEFLVNCAGLYSDKIASLFKIEHDYVIIPYKGLYLKYLGNNKFIGKSIYPVPLKGFPFLGIHFTVSDVIKIGPTALPALYRENYFNNFALLFKNFNEFKESFIYNLKMLLFNKDYKKLFFREIYNLFKSSVYNKAKKLVKEIPSISEFNWALSGIRAQLVNKKTLKLEDDFIILDNGNNIHILNAVSPAFTASFPFTAYIVNNYLKSKI
jgi:L-2-hydroxyglutarate oxidase LhgO